MTLHHRSDMARKAKDVTPLSGVIKNGSRWWLRTVKAPLLNQQIRLSTGTTDVARANRIKEMVDMMADQPKQYEWLSLVVRGTVSLDRLYNHHAEGTLPALAKQLDAVAIVAADGDLDPLVTAWETELKTQNLEERTRVDYVRGIRVLIPPGVRFPASQFTEATLKAKLDGLIGARHDRSQPLSSSAKRRLVAAWKLFFAFARERGVLDRDPFANKRWIPKNGKGRRMSYDHATILRVLACVKGDAYRAALALMFGSGIELGALAAMTRADVIEEERAVKVHGRWNPVTRQERLKNEHRDRTIFVDAWAWKIFFAYAKTKLPRASMWDVSVLGHGAKMLREALYAAEVAAGLVDAPPISATTRKPEWSKVRVHTMHDCRHSYVINRSLGLDGEEAQGMPFLAAQLGHADEQMLITLYKKENITERLRKLKLQRDQQKAAARQAKAGAA